MAGALTLGVDWEALGAEASARVDAAFAILVTGRDPVAAARVAVGLGQVQSRTRRVAIGDLVGEVEPLQRLVTGDDPHGIVDSFLYGVSLNKIARQVDDAGMLFVMPSGTEPTVTPEIMTNERWSRLSAGFREVGALLILVAGSDAEGLRSLAEMMDGVVVVGDAASVLAVPRNSVLAHVEPPLAPTPLMSPAVPELPPAAPTGGEAPQRKSPTVVMPVKEPAEKRPTITFAKEGMPKLPLIAAGVLLLLVVLWFALGRPGMAASNPDTNAGAAAAADSAQQASDSAAASSGPVTIANPADSAKAVPYSVVLVATNDEAQALARWASQALKLPAGTVTMVRIRGERGKFFQVHVGAYGAQQQADSLLAALRANGRLRQADGSVKVTPFALRLEAGTPRTSAADSVNAYGLKQIPAYSLLQADNTVNIYVGAFETPEQAAPLMNELLRKGVNVTLHYRTGRSF